MKILWICKLVEEPLPNYWMPRISHLNDQLEKPFPCVWTTTNGDINGYAVGIADVDAGQLAAIDTDGQIYYVQYSDRQITWNSLSDGLRANIKSVKDIVTSISDIVENVFDNLIQTIEPKTIEYINNELDKEATIQEAMKK